MKDNDWRKSLVLGVAAMAVAIGCAGQPAPMVEVGGPASVRGETSARSASAPSASSSAVVGPARNCAEEPATRACCGALIPACETCMEAATKELREWQEECGVR